MLRDLCRVVPFVCASLTLTACFGSHGGTGDAGSDTGAPPPDSGSVDGGVSDSGSGGDSGPWDGGTLGCPEAPLDLLCGTDTVFAGVEQTIDVLIGASDRCYCGERIDCVARYGAEPFTLSIEAGLCADGALCDACFPYVDGTCTLPPLEAGSWRVDINGEPALQLGVLEPDVLPEMGAECTSPARVDDASCGITWPPADGDHDQVCHPQAVYPNTRAELEVTRNCGSCGESAGPCEVEIFDDVIRVRPSTVYSGCDVDCPAICVPRTDVCTTPPLPEGTWRVFVEGAVDFESTIVSTGDPGFAPDEICVATTSGGTGGTDP